MTPSGSGSELKKPAVGAALCDVGQVGRVAIPAAEGDGPALQGRGIKRRSWQHTGLVSPLVAGEVEAQHGWAALQRAGEAAIVVQRGAQRGQAGLQVSVRAGQLLQRLQPGAGIGFSEQQIEADHRGLLAHKQLVGQCCHSVATPRPAAHFGEALFVDVDYHDPGVERSRHVRSQPSVGDGQVDLLHKAQRPDPDGMCASSINTATLPTARHAGLAMRRGASSCSQGLEWQGA